MENIMEIEEQQWRGTRRKDREGGCVVGAVEQEKTSVSWEHSDGLSFAPLCRHCWSASQN